jgi:rare lipoprotein A
MTAAPPVASPTPDSLVAEQKAIKRGDRLHGIASWYGAVFHGRKTASGERFDMFAMTACHPTLPFGSLVRVVNLTNKHSVVVKINDRGDLIDEGRIIDLSYAAAQKLAMTKSGLVNVELQVISLGRYRADN